MESRGDSNALSGLIFGKYRVLDRLGRGGMAEVYKALSVGVAGFQRPVVLKRILPHLASNRQFVDMFVKEASIAASLDHPNIVQVFDLGRHEGDLFMVLEFVPGIDLGSLIAHFGATGEALSHQLVAFVAVDVCKALECAHGHRNEEGRSAPVIHRDISPQNVLLSLGGAVKLADFGLAMPTGGARVTMPGIIKGKLGYMSPEQAAGDRDLDTRSDLFSLGIVLYEALSGRRLFVGRNPVDTMRRVREVMVPPLTSVAQSVPEPLADLVHHLLSKSRDDRPDSAADVRKALLTFLRAVSPPVDTTTLASVVRRVVGERADGAEVEESPEDEATQAHVSDDDLEEEDDRPTITTSSPPSHMFPEDPELEDSSEDTGSPDGDGPADQHGPDEEDMPRPPTDPEASSVLISRVVTVGGPDKEGSGDK